MTNNLLRLFALNLEYAHHLLAGLDPKQMADQPVPGMNHAAWIVGHLGFNADKIVVDTMLHRGVDFPAQWIELFHNESVPQSDLSVYPGKDALMQMLDSVHQRVEGLVREQPRSWVDEPATFSNRFRTIGEALTWVLVGHEALHLGQLSAWRRAMKLPGV